MKNIHHSCFAIIAILLAANLSPAQVGGPYLPHRQYWGQNQLVEYVPGTSPIIISSPHGGRLKPSFISDRTFGVFGVDVRTQEFAIELAQKITKLTGKRPHLILSHLNRIKLDPNREIVEAAQGDVDAEQAWHDYHDFIEDARLHIQTQYGQGLYLDIHGHGHPESWIEFGYSLSGNTLNLNDLSLNTQSNIDDTSVRHTVTMPGNTLSGVLRGTTSLGGIAESLGFSSVPSPMHPGPMGGSYFSGGYQVDRHGSRDSGTIDAVQIELPNFLRKYRQDRNPITSALALAAQNFLTGLQGTTTLDGSEVSLGVVDAWCSETGSRGQIRAFRTGPVNQARTINISISGDAAYGIDFAMTSSPTQVTIPAGSSEVLIDFIPIDDALSEGAESIIVRVDDFVHTRDLGSVTLIIQDDEVDPSAQMILNLDESGGAIASDSSGLNNDATLLPNSTTGPQRIVRDGGLALRFDGIDDQIRISDFPWSAQGAGTLAFFFRTSSNTTTGLQYLVSQGGLAGSPDSLNIYYLASTQNLRIALAYNNDLSNLDTLDIDLPIRDGAWHHLALTMEASNRTRVFIDGVLASETYLGGTTLDPTTDLYFGGRFDQSSTRYFDGDFDRIELYSRSLNKIEVKALAQGLPHEAHPYPGTQDDLQIISAVSGPLNTNPIKQANAGEIISVGVYSPSGSFVGAWVGLGLQPMLTGVPPYQPQLPLVYLFDGLATETIPFTLLSPLGVYASGPVPQGLVGISALFQGYTFSKTANNGIYALTDGHEIRLN